MEIIIFHYHLLPGGVTDVIISSVLGFLRYCPLCGNITLVSGRSENLKRLKEKLEKNLNIEERKRISWQLFPLMDYREKITSPLDNKKIKEELERRYGGCEFLWWVHNYHLGKNPVFTRALIDIAGEGEQKILCQIHDFPECSRFELYKELKDEIKGELYPQGGNIRYAVINSRDEKLLLGGGMRRESLFLLENPLDPLPSRGDTSSKSTLSKLERFARENGTKWIPRTGYMLYPVRGIRRKNILEAALLAELTQKNLIVTLPGRSDREIDYSDLCEKLFLEREVPGLYGIGATCDPALPTYEELIDSSSLILSSSVQEGFGYLFLGAMNWQKPLVARDLDTLDSFKKHFKDYPAYFYSSFKIPYEDKEKWNCLNRRYYKKMVALEPLTGPLNHEPLGEKSVDFSYLSLKEQISLIRSLKGDQKLKEQIKEMNRDLLTTIDLFFTKKPSSREHLIESNWGLEAYGGNLEEIVSSFNNIPLDSRELTMGGKISSFLLKSFATRAYMRLLYDRET